MPDSPFERPERANDRHERNIRQIRSTPSDRNLRRLSVSDRGKKFAAGAAPREPVVTVVP
jgi:hypothetical protein